MSRLTTYVPSTWRLLAEEDQSESYEIDVTEIFLDEDGRFVLAQASGCSCWDGAYDAEAYDTLDAVAEAVSILGKDRPYHLSPAGGERLVVEARANLPAMLATLAADLS